MNEDKMYEMLMSIMQDLAVVKSKLDTLEEIKIDAKTSNAKIERLENITERQEKQISVLENRSNILEQFVRDNMVESKKEKNSIMLSIGIAVFSAVLSLLFRYLVMLNLNLEYPPRCSPTKWLFKNTLMDMLTPSNSRYISSSSLKSI